MVDVINEKWKALHDEAIDAWDIVEDDQDETILAHRGGFLTTHDPGWDEARARLAAQAPAMARLLLELMTDPDLDDYAHTRAETVLRAAGVLT